MRSATYRVTLHERAGIEAWLTVERDRRPGVLVPLQLWLLIPGIGRTAITEQTALTLLEQRDTRLTYIWTGRVGYRTRHYRPLH